MANSQQAEHTAKLSDIDGVPRGRVPAAIVQYLNGRAGDYLVFRISKSGVVTVALRQPTAAETKQAVAKKRK